MKKLLTVALSFALVSLTLTPARAVLGGALDIGDSRVVSIVRPQESPRNGCTGSLIAPQIVVSAAHCLVANGVVIPGETYIPTDLWVAQPGVDLNVDDVNTRVRIMEAVVTAGSAMAPRPIAEAMVVPILPN